MGQDDPWDVYFVMALSQLGLDSQNHPRALKTAEGFMLRISLSFSRSLLLALAMV